MLRAAPETPPDRLGQDRAVLAWPGLVGAGSSLERPTLESHTLERPTLERLTLERLMPVRQTLERPTLEGCMLGRSVPATSDLLQDAWKLLETPMQCGLACRIPQGFPF